MWLAFVGTTSISNARAAQECRCVRRLGLSRDSEDHGRRLTSVRVQSGSLLVHKQAGRRCFRHSDLDQRCRRDLA